MRAVTLRFAVGSDLDAIASRYPSGMPRYENETYDDVGDARYRKRIWLSPNPLSPHGPAESYQFWALNAIGGVLRDVSTVKIRPRLEEAPIIVITCMADGADPRPTTAQLLEIRRYIQNEARLAMTDVVSVQAPKIVVAEYKIRVTLFPGPDKLEMAAKLKANLEAMVENQRWLGFDHTRLAISGACAITGVKNIEIISPAADVPAPSDWLVQVKNYDPVSKTFTVSPIEIVGRGE